MTLYRKLFWGIFIIAFISIINTASAQSDPVFRTLTKEDLSSGAHHLNHYKIFSKYTSGYNLQILQAIDSVQAHAMDGGTYFIGLKSDPPESPVYYELKLDGKSLINPPRKSSYCSGSTYSAFIEALNKILPDASKKLSDERFEALRMQEPDGARREDWVKFWGIWNADGFGSQYAIAQYSNMGVDVKPDDAMPGDFANISWTSGNGHSVIILGWYVNDNGDKCLLYWSSQKGTNGYGDQLSKLKDIKEIKIVRLTKPENLFNFDTEKAIKKSIPGDIINWK
jgi:hypothetical protein